MYLAKYIGRNRVCLATDLDSARGIDALFAQLTSLAALRADAGTQEPAGSDRAIYDYTVQTVTALAATIDSRDHYTEATRATSLHWQWRWRASWAACARNWRRSGWEGRCTTWANSSSSRHSSTSPAR